MDENAASVLLLAMAVLLVSPPEATSSPPRVSGVYFGGLLNAAVVTTRLTSLEPDPAHFGSWGALRLGQTVFPWLTLGVEGAGGMMFTKTQVVQQGGMHVEAGFLPVPRYPFSIRIGVGFGAGFVQDNAKDGERDGFGGPQFMGALRYEFFPGAKKRRPNRRGGFSLGPEIGWRAFTPPLGNGVPSAHTFSLGLWLGYYWGR